MVRDYRQGDKWIPGTIHSRTGPMAYKVKVQNGIWRRHVDQILASRKEIADDFAMPDLQTPLQQPSPELYAPPPPPTQAPESPASPPPTQQTPPPPTPAQTSTTTQKPLQTSVPVPPSPESTVTRRYPARDRKPPERLSY